MAFFEKRPNGSYRIRVSCGYGVDGKQKTQSKTWKPPREGMTDKQIENALNKAKSEFEMACAGGKVVNNHKLQNLIE